VDAEVRIAKISSKGQVIIPERFCDVLRTNQVKLYMAESRVVVEPVEELNGVFRGCV